MSKKLDELEERASEAVAAEVEREFTTEMLEEFVAGVTRALSDPAISARIKGRMEGAGLDANGLARRERREEEERDTGKRRRGPTRGQRETPTARAALDMWRIRKVIFPRFWPEVRDHGWHKLEVARIAADRHPGATAKATDSWYENNRVASL